MRVHWIFFALLVVGCATTARIAQNGWTERAVSGLTIKLVDDPTKVEWLSFGPGGKVSVTWGTVWKGTRVTTTPWLDWRFSDGRVQILEDARVAEELTFIRREGSHLILRMKGGKIGRFLIQREGV
jgi:hypothetical protein